MVQLQMIWPEERRHAPPPVTVAPGYTLRTLQPDEQQAYLDLMHMAGFDSFAKDTFDSACQRILPGGFFVIEHNASGALVATTMATHKPTPLHPFGGELGWVAGDPAHKGRGLGVSTCAAVVDLFLKRGYDRIYLLTDDFRLPAIKCYLKLGFVPFLHEEDVQVPWQTVCESLNWPAEPDTWPRPEQTSPAATEAEPDPDKPKALPDADCAGKYAKRIQMLPNRVHRGHSCDGDTDCMGDESLYHPSRLGTATVTPHRLPAASTSPLELRYVVGENGLQAGARIRFVMRGQSPLGYMKDISISVPPSCKAETDRLGVHLTEGTLQEGDEVICRAESFDWTPLAKRTEIKVVITLDPTKPEQRLPEPLVVETLALEPHRLEVTLPATHGPDAQSLRCTLTVRDPLDNRVPWTGTVTVKTADETQTVPMVHGLARTQVTTQREAMRVTATAEDLSLQGESNPSVRQKEYQLYVGDLHCHDFLSEAEGYSDSLYRWAQEDRTLDFLSPSCQCHGWLDNETWTVTKYMNERYLDEGRFVSLLAFEWQHTGYGDKVVHYLGGDQPYLPVLEAPWIDAEKLYAAVSQSDAVVIGHHGAYPAGSWCSATNFDAVDTRVEPLAEIWSMHGSSEGYDSEDRPLRNMDSENMVYGALRRGLRLGFTAGSDTHSARPGGSAKEPMPYWGGQVAVWAKSLTRREIFAALKARRTVALTRARVVLKMTVNGAWMGEEIPFAKDVTVQIACTAPGEISKVEVMKNTAVWQTPQPDDNTCNTTVTDTIAEPAFYHCRVTMADGNLAVCSPVWVG